MTAEEKFEAFRVQNTPNNDEKCDVASFGSGSVITNRSTVSDLAASDNRSSLQSCNLVNADISREMFSTPKIDTETGGIDDLEKGHQ